jgi:hypothetical protein
MPVDSFKFLPRLIATFYKMTEVEPEFPIPWTPLPHRVEDCVFGLITSGGLYQRGVEPPFDLDREWREPTWGDRSYRTIPTDIHQEDIGVSHLHINTESVLEDMNVLLPVIRFKELAEEGRIGGLTENAYSFMGYQGFPPDTSSWRNVQGPEVAEKFKSQGAKCVFLAPA